MEIRELEFDEWEEMLPDTGFDVFHSTEALRLLNRHTTADLHLLGGFKGQQPIGLFPVFERNYTIGQLVTSPPLGYGVVRLGPLVMPTSPKPRKRESVNKKFVRSVIEHLEANTKSTLFRIACDPRYGDPRPFRWTGFNIEPSFTYQLDLESATSDQVLNSFSSDRRKEIRNWDDDLITVRTGGVQDAKKTYESIQARYREQNLKVPHEWGFVRDLIETLDDRIRVYVAETLDGEFISGVLVLYSNDTAYNWKGSTKSAAQDLPVSPNSVLHWKIIEDILEDPALDSIERYDMYSANEERLSPYKSSFGGDLRPYYIIESPGLGLKAAKGAYQLAAHGKHPFGQSPVKSLNLLGN